MDLKDWKKVSEDKLGVEMMHPKGHKMTILYKGVPVIQREALRRLPLHGGGDVKGVHKSASEVEKPSSKSEKHMAGESHAGEHVRSSDIRSGANEKAKDEHNKVLGEMKSMPQPKLKGLADGGKPEDGQDVDSSDAQTPPPVTVNVNANPESPAAQQASAPVNVQPPNISAAGPSPTLPNGSMSAPGAAQLAQQANSEQAKIEAAKSQAMVPVEQAKLEAQKQQAIRDQNNINILRQHADTMANTLQNIDPSHYVKNMSAPAKVSTAIGLALGSFSQPFGGHNWTGDYLNKQIDRDIDAQKANNEKQKTIWGAYNSLYGDQNVASNMAKASMADIYATQAQVVAQKLGTPQALANLHKIQSDLAITKNKAILDAAGNLRSTPNNPLGRPQPAQAEAPAATPSGTPAPESPPNEGPSDLENVGSIIGKTVKEGALASLGLLKRGDQTEKSEAAETKKKESALDKPQSYRLLSPDAESRLGDLQYGAPGEKQDYAAASDQFTSLQQAEKVLNGDPKTGANGVHDLFKRMYHSANQAGLLGAAQRKGSAIIGGIAALGANALGAGPVGDAVAGDIGSKGAVPAFTQAQKQYELARSKLMTDIGSALHGVISVGDFNHLADIYAPRYGDTPEMAMEREKAFISSIKNALKTSYLHKYKMLAD